MTVLSELARDARFILHYRAKTLKVQRVLDRNAPKPGELAPDFTLLDICGIDSVTLSDFRGDKPVALVFGSFT